MKRKMKTLFASLLALILVAPLCAQSVALTREQLIAITPKWEGERFPDGRPLVSDELIARVKNLTLVEVWAGCREANYNTQYAGEWKMIHENQTLVGRALTAQYMPSRVEMSKVLYAQGEKDGRIGNMVSWPIDELSPGDIYVADSYGKLNDGPIIGDNLATSIWAKSKNGVVFNGTIRDLEGISDIEGFNAYVTGWHPSHQIEMMLTGINVPIRIKEATVLPGDVVLAKRGGIMFIPPHLVAQIVISGEFSGLCDKFGIRRLREGKYTPGQIDNQWTDEIKKDFISWLDKNPDQLPMPREELDDYLNNRSW